MLDTHLVKILGVARGLFSRHVQSYHHITQLRPAQFRRVGKACPRGGGGRGLRLSGKTMTAFRAVPRRLSGASAPHAALQAVYLSATVALYSPPC